jgi:adenylosuccinate lyase
MTGGNFQAKTISKFIQKPCDDKQNLRGRIEVLAQSAQKKPCMNFTQGLQAIGLSFAFNICNVLA